MALVLNNHGQTFALQWGYQMGGYCAPIVILEIATLGLSGIGVDLVIWTFFLDLGSYTTPTFVPSFPLGTR